MLLSLVTVFLMTFGITAICVGVGALYPKFTFDHAAEIPTSFGGAVCMIVSIAFIGVTVMIEAWPIYLLAMRGLSPGLSRRPELLGHCAVPSRRVRRHYSRCRHPHRTRAKELGTAQRMTPAKAQKARQVQTKERFFLCVLGVLAGKINSHLKEITREFDPYHL